MQTLVKCHNALAFSPPVIIRSVHSYMCSDKIIWTPLIFTIFEILVIYHITPKITSGYFKKFFEIFGLFSGFQLFYYCYFFYFSSKSQLISGVRLFMGCFMLKSQGNLKI